MKTKKIPDSNKLKLKEGVYMPAKPIGRIVLLSGFLLLSMLVIGNSAFALKPGNDLQITEVLVDFDAEIITIIGEDFDFGNNLQVMLGEIGNITSQCSVTLTPRWEITCDFTENGLPADGDYRLTVYGGSGQTQHDEYDLTIGTAGQQDPTLTSRFAIGYDGSTTPQVTSAYTNCESVEITPGSAGGHFNVSATGYFGGMSSAYSYRLIANLSQVSDTEDFDKALIFFEMTGENIRLMPFHLSDIIANTGADPVTFYLIVRDVFGAAGKTIPYCMGRITVEWLP